MTVTPKLDSRVSALRPKDSGTPEVTVPAAKAAPANSFTQAASSKPVSLVSPAARNVVLPSMTPGSAKAEALTVLPVRPELNRFLESTRDLRATLETLRTLSPTDPKYAAAAQHLKAKYGYTPETAPKPGTQWVSPRLSEDLLPGGAPSASKWPTGTGTTKPADPAEALFSYGKKPVLQTADGRKVTVNSPEEYRALIAENRAAMGIGNPDGSPAGGEPKAVHLTMEGGGGLGKRYAPALSEMYSMGIVPASVSGTSIGGIAAGLIAAGADPATVHQIATDPNVEKFFDFGLGTTAPTKGKYMYEYIDQKLKELTGIHDRPVTFADLKIPLHLPAAIMSDSMPPPGTDYSKAENRLFMFGPETTPNTPVVYAMLATGAFPGVLPTVDLVDPATGRTLVLTDSGVIDGLPMNLGDPDLPEVGLSLQEPYHNHPESEDNTRLPKALPKGDIDTSNPIAYAKNSFDMLKNGGADRKDFLDRSQPKAGEFMLSLPIFNLDDARKRDSTLKFQADPKVDPELDKQGHRIARDFFTKVFNDIGDPTAKATNLITQVPEKVAFERTIELDGQRYVAEYDGGDKIRFTVDSGLLKGLKIDVKAGEQKVEAMFLDELTFGALDGQLKTVLHEHFNPLDGVLNNLPF